MAIATVVVAFSSCSEDEEKTVTVNFNGLLLEAESEYVGPREGELPENVYYYESTFNDPTNTVTFSHYATAAGDYFGGGFTYTNKTDKTTNGFTNSSAITGKGQYGDTYMTCNADGTYRYAVIKLKSSTTVKGAYFTNSTYGYLTMRDGGEFGAKVFGTDDWFKVIVTGKNKGTATSSLDIYLAKDGNIVNTWIWQDLTTLGIVDELNFSFESTDNGQFGMNTPAYFCLDGLTIVM